jgi:chromatin remodeling complex protein RSC6
MTETLALIKRLHLRKLCILDEIDELTMEKHDVEHKINNLLFSTPYNKEKKTLRNNSCVSKFCIPSKISDELAEFLGKEKGTIMSRTDISREINKYIRINNLQDNYNKRNINPDANLLNLLKLNYGDQLTYFNLQKYISPHVNNNA